MSPLRAGVCPNDSPGHLPKKDTFLVTRRNQRVVALANAKDNAIDAGMK